MALAHNITFVSREWSLVVPCAFLGWLANPHLASLDSGRGSRERDSSWDYSWDFNLCRNSVHIHETPTLPGHSSCLERRTKSTRPTTLSLWSRHTDIHHWPGLEVSQGENHHRFFSQDKENAASSGGGSSCCHLMPPPPPAQVNPNVWPPPWKQQDFGAPGLVLKLSKIALALPSQVLMWGSLWEHTAINRKPSVYTCPSGKVRATWWSTFTQC